MLINKKPTTQIYLALLYLMLASQLLPKIRLFTFHYNHPDFLEIQYRLLQKFLIEKDDFELIVFSDATDQLMKMRIEETCTRLHVQCVNFPQKLHNDFDNYPPDILKRMAETKMDCSNGSIRHSQLVQFALTHFGYQHNDIIGIMEGDVFLVKNFSIRQTLRDFDIVGGMQTDRIGKNLKYIWIGLAFFKLNTLPKKEMFNFNISWIDNAFLDAGGNTYNYLKNNPTVTTKMHKGIQVKELANLEKATLIPLNLSLAELEFLHNMKKYYQSNKEYFPPVEYYMNNCFIHYGWSRLTNSSHPKSKVFKEFFDALLQ